MKKKQSALTLCLIAVLCFVVAGCASVPKNLMVPDKGSLERRQFQARQYDTRDEQKMMSAVSGVVQDLGFTLDNSETKVGFIAASKKADATSGGQIAGAILLDTLCALGGTYGGATASCDKAQMVKASIIVQPSGDGSKTVVRATFQRVIWNMTDRVSRLETINDPKIYQTFFTALNKAVFLEGQQI
jgi:hypothetical protein